MRAIVLLMLAFQIAAQRRLIDFTAQPLVAANASGYSLPALEGASGEADKPLALKVRVESIKHIQAPVGTIEVVLEALNANPTSIAMPIVHRQCRQSDGAKELQLVVRAVSGRHPLNMAASTCVTASYGASELQQGEAVYMRLRGRLVSVLPGVSDTEIGTAGVEVVVETIRSWRVETRGTAQLMGRR